MFTMRIDETPPFLTLLSPASGSLSSAPEIELLGASEPEPSLAVNGGVVTVGPDGRFIQTVPLLRGAIQFRCLRLMLPGTARPGRFR